MNHSLSITHHLVDSTLLKKDLLAKNSVHDSGSIPEAVESSMDNRRTASGIQPGNSGEVGSREFPPIVMTHPDICRFYANHMAISPETVHLAWIDMLEKTHPVMCADVISDPNRRSSYRKQTDEMKELIDQLREYITQIITHISQEYIFVKSEYVNEFKSVWSQSCCVSRRDILHENNRKLIHNIEKLTYHVRNIKRTHASIGDKSESIVKQFHKIMHNNIETILTKPTETENMVREFNHNFEINSTHMMNTITQLLTDFIQSKEVQSTKISESFSLNGESAISAYCKFVYEIKDILTYFDTYSTAPPAESSRNMVSLLSRLYNTGYIQPDDSDASISILSRDEKPTICIQQLQIKDRNVNTDEIARFLLLAKEKNVHGILVSQHTGITSKPNLYIEIHHNRVYIYLHSMEYSPEKLQTAIDIVDTISSKLTDFNTSTEQKYTIPKDILDEINREYQAFITQKETILATMKDSYKKILSQLEELRFGSLDKFLSTRYSYFKKQGYLCTLCNVFSVSTLKGLAAHKRGCTRKLCSGTSTATNFVFEDASSTGNLQTLSIVSKEVVYPIESEIQKHVVAKVK